jgi:hypothetical protein
MSYVRSGREKGRSLDGFTDTSLKIPRRCCREREGKNTSSWEAGQEFDFAIILSLHPQGFFLGGLKLINFQYKARCEIDFDHITLKLLYYDIVRSQIK